MGLISQWDGGCCVFFAVGFVGCLWVVGSVGGGFFILVLFFLFSFCADRKKQRALRTENLFL